MVRYEIARQKAIDAGLDITTPRPAADHHTLLAEVERLREAARTRLRAEARQTYVGAPDKPQAHVNAVGLPEATAAMTEAAIETVWRVNRRARVHLWCTCPTILQLSMALVVADLSESQRETLVNLIFQRGVQLTALTVDQLREFLITLFHAPKSSLKNPSWARKPRARSLIASSHGELGQYEGHLWFKTSTQVMKASLMSMRTSSGCMTKSSACGRGSPSRDATSRRVAGPEGKGNKGSQKEEKDQLHRQFLSVHKGKE